MWVSQISDFRASLQVHIWCNGVNWKLHWFCWCWASANCPCGRPITHFIFYMSQEDTDVNSNFTSAWNSEVDLKSDRLLPLRWSKTILILWCYKSVFWFEFPMNESSIQIHNVHVCTTHIAPKKLHGRGEKELKGSKWFSNIIENLYQTVFPSSQ